MYVKERFNEVYYGLELLTALSSVSVVLLVILLRCMYRNVIDVAAMGAHNLEQHEYLERVKHYSIKLQAVSSRSLMPHKTCLLVDIPAPDKIVNMIITETDFFQVRPL